jgi:hypothetical protein
LLRIAAKRPRVLTPRPVFRCGDPIRQNEHAIAIETVDLLVAERALGVAIPDDRFLSGSRRRAADP